MSELPEIISDEDWSKSEGYDTLGPHYFTARRVCEEAMSGFTPEMMKPLIEEASKSFQDKLWEHIEDSLWCDTEMNLQGKMWHMIDDVVKAILGGNEWAIKRYALGERYDCQSIRETLAKHIPEELQSARITDLEAEVKRLQESLEFHRERF